MISCMNGSFLRKRQASGAVSAVGFRENAGAVLVIQRAGIGQEEAAHGLAGIDRQRHHFVGADAVVAHLEVVHAAGLLQVCQSGEEILRLVCFGDTHDAGHLDELAVAGVVFDEVRGEGEGDHDEAGAVGQIRMVGAHGVFHGVLCRGGGELHGDACEGAAVGHAGARLEVIAVRCGAGQVSGDIFDGGEGEGLAEEVHAVGHHHFRVVEEGVEALIGGVFRRNGAHELRIDHGDLRDEPRVAAEADLFMGVEFGNDAPVIELGAGAGSESDGHDGERVAGQRLGLAGAAHHIVPEVAGVGGHGGYGHGGVQHGAAAYGEDEVAAVFPGGSGRFHHEIFRGIFVDDGAGHGGDAGLFHLGGDDVQRTAQPGRLAGGEEQERLLSGQCFLTERGQLAGAEKKLRGGKECELHGIHKNTSFMISVSYGT